MHTCRPEGTSRASSAAWKPPPHGRHDGPYVPRPLASSGHDAITSELPLDWRSGYLWATRRLAPENLPAKPMTWPWVAHRCWRYLGERRSEGSRGAGCGCWKDRHGDVDPKCMSFSIDERISDLYYHPSDSTSDSQLASPKLVFPRKARTAMPGCLRFASWPKAPATAPLCHWEEMLSPQVLISLWFSMNNF